MSLVVDPPLSRVGLALDALVVQSGVMVQMGVLRSPCTQVLTALSRSLICDGGGSQ